MIANRFRVAKRAGRGGMGEVWAAIDASSSERIALKVMLDPATWRARFARLGSRQRGRK